MRPHSPIFRLLAVAAGAVVLVAGAKVRAAELDPPAAPSRSVTFDEAIARALARNPSALIAQQEILRAEALVRQARSGSLPLLTGSTLGQRLDQERVQVNAGGRVVVQAAQSLSASAQLLIPLVAAQRWMLWLQARDQTELSKVSADDVRRSLAVGAARAYLAVVAQRRNLEVSDRAFRTAQAHFEHAHGRRIGGVGNRLDEVRAEQEEQSTRAQALLARSNLARTQEALGVVLAEDGAVDAAAEPTLLTPLSLEEALREAEQRRGDVRLLRERVTVAKNRLNRSWADYMPSLTGTFQPFYQNPPTLTQPETGWQAQLLLSIPFYDGGLRYGQQDERKVLVTQAEIALQGAVRQVQAEVRTTYATLQQVQAAYQAARSSAKQAREAFDLPNMDYIAGATTNLEVVDAERRARDAETLAAIAEDAARQALLDVLAASGRFP
ncbi:MAG: TolC family protein [Deltaproteobacteria bacterium]|nr:TolC family protein [Deltaproteobacteria bacterium]